MDHLQTLHGTGLTDWRTPAWFYAVLDREFNFTLDPCATPDPAKRTFRTPRWYAPPVDGLAQEWQPRHGPGERVFVNPPYQRGAIGQWVAKAADEAQFNGALCVLLLPVRTDADWWQSLVGRRAQEIRFVKGRLRFERADGEPAANGAGFPSAVVVFYPWARSPRSGPAHIYWDPRPAAATRQEALACQP